MQRQPAHRKTSARRWPVVLAVVAALLVVGGGATAVVWVARAQPPPRSPTVAPKSVVPFNVIATTPSASANVVPSATNITVSFSAPIAPEQPEADPVAGGSGHLVARVARPSSSSSPRPRSFPVPPKRSSSPAGRRAW